MTSATTGHATCRRGNSVWPSTTLTMARAMSSRARIPRRRRASRSRSGGSALARGPVVGGPLKGLFNARMRPRGVIQPPALFLRWPSLTAFAPATPVLPSSSAVISNYGISRLHDILDVLHHDDHFVSIARVILIMGAGLAEIARLLLILFMSASNIERFRQLDSKAPGHPEYRWTSGVEATTGPLGQGVATSVGMAIAGRWMARQFNRPGFDLFGYDVYALCGDGCMMEGISGEAASLAGHLELANLCWIYDNNKITIEGHTDWAFSEDVATRFIAYRWNVTRVGDANDLDMLRRAFRTFHATTDRPTLIIVDSHIAYGAPNKQDTSAAHGEPLGEEEIRLTKRTYDW